MRMKKVSLSVFASFFLTMLVGYSQPMENATGTKKREVMRSELRNTHKEKMKRFLNGQLPIGFYIYLYRWKENKDQSAIDLDEAIKEMAKRGFNYLYVGGVNDSPVWRRLLTLCKKLRITVVAQLDFAYLRAQKKAEVKGLIARAVPFIKKYKDHPALMAFSVCEEPSIAIMPALQHYYKGILKEVPDAPLHLIFNNLPQFVSMKPPYPSVIGTDRYAFWWEMWGQRATPWFALEWYRTQLDRYYQLTTKKGGDFQAVFTASTLETFVMPERLKASFYPDTISMTPEARKVFYKDPYSAMTSELRERLYRNTLELVANKNQGWDKGVQGSLRFWKYYRPPGNCVRAMSWLSIMEGARSVAVWAWSPPRKNMKNFEHRFKGKPGVEYINSITGWDGKGTPQLDEYAEFSVQIQRYARLIRSMSKECVPMDEKSLPLGHEPAAGTEGAKAIFDVKGNDVAWQSFKIPRYSGKVILVVNTSVGSWCKGQSPHYLTPDDQFRIDKFGNAMDYKSFEKPRILTCRILLQGMECIDLESGKTMSLNDNQTMKISITPGGGRFLFLAPKGSSEWLRLKKRFGL